MNEKILEHLLAAVQHQQRALGIVYGGAKLSPQAAEEFARAFGKAANELVRARAAGDHVQEAEATLALR